MENTENNIAIPKSIESPKLRKDGQIDRRGKNPNSLANLEKHKLTSETAKIISSRPKPRLKPITEELQRQVNELVAQQLAKSMIKRAKKDTYTMNTLMDRVDGPIVHQQQIDVNCNLAVLIAEARARIKDDGE